VGRRTERSRRTSRCCRCHGAPPCWSSRDLVALLLHPIALTLRSGKHLPGRAPISWQTDRNHAVEASQLGGRERHGFAVSSCVHVLLSAVMAQEPSTRRGDQRPPLAIAATTRAIWRGSPATAPGRSPGCMSRLHTTLRRSGDASHAGVGRKPGFSLGRATPVHCPRPKSVAHLTTPFTRASRGLSDRSSCCMSASARRRCPRASDRVIAAQVAR